MFQAIRGHGKCKSLAAYRSMPNTRINCFCFCKCEFILRGKSHVLSQGNPLTIITKTLAKGICTPAGTKWLGFIPIRQRGDGEYGCRTLTGLSEPVKGKACGLDQLLVRSSEARPAEAAWPPAKDILTVRGMGKMFRGETFALRLVGRYFDFIESRMLRIFYRFGCRVAFNTKRIVLHGALAHGV